MRLTKQGPVGYERNPAAREGDCAIGCSEERLRASFQEVSVGSRGELVQSVSGERKAKTSMLPLAFDPVLREAD